MRAAITTAVDQVGIVGSNGRQDHAARNWIGVRGPVRRCTLCSVA